MALLANRNAEAALAQVEIEISRRVRSEQLALSRVTDARRSVADSSTLVELGAVGREAPEAKVDLRNDVEKSSVRSAWSARSVWYT